MGVIRCLIGCEAITLLMHALKIKEFAQGDRRVTTADALKLTETYRSTLRQHFRNLAAQSHVQQQGNGGGVWQ